MPRWPTGPFEMRRTGCYGCVRMTPSDGSCGVAGHPCVHRGVDLFAKDSTVVAPDSGVVAAVANGTSSPWVGYGPGVIMIEGDSGKYLLLSHLDFGSISVTKGERVTEGQPLARFASNYGHTHFEVRHKMTGPSATNTMDPITWIDGGSRRLLNLLLLGFVAWGAHRLYRGGALF